MSTIAKLADETYQTTQMIKNLQEREKDLKGQLAGELVANKLDEVVGSLGQRYKVRREPPRHVFDLFPEEEFDRLGLRTECTAPPKMGKTKMDEFLKRGLIDHQTIADWKENGWYAIENTGALSVTQLKSDPKDVLPEIPKKAS